MGLVVDRAIAMLKVVAQQEQEDAVILPLQMPPVDRFLLVIRLGQESQGKLGTAEMLVVQDQRVLRETQVNLHRDWVTRFQAGLVETLGTLVAQVTAEAEVMGVVVGQELPNQLSPDLVALGVMAVAMVGLEGKVFQFLGQVKIWAMVVLEVVVQVQQMMVLQQPIQLPLVAQVCLILLMGGKVEEEEIQVIIQCHYTLDLVLFLETTLAPLLQEQIYRQI